MWIVLLNGAVSDLRGVLLQCVLLLGDVFMSSGDVMVLPGRVLVLEAVPDSRRRELGFPDYQHCLQWLEDERASSRVLFIEERLAVVTME